MALNKANVRKAQKQLNELRYANRMRELCSHQPARIYSVVKDGVEVARAPIDQCVKYGRGYQFIPWNQEGFASNG